MQEIAVHILMSTLIVANLAGMLINTRFPGLKKRTDPWIGIWLGTINAIFLLALW